MDVQFLLLETLQLLFTGGVGGVLIVAYATRGLFATDVTPMASDPPFASDYDELMWLAERQKNHLSKEETQRFYQLRQRWSEMHSFLTAARSPFISVS